MKKLATLITILVLGAFAPVVTAQDAAPPAVIAEAPAAAVAAPVAAPEAAPAPAGPDAAAVAADTLAYFNNVAPTGPLAGLPGPGHTGFLMICAALVLFMTLPGLALFYGGLVRHKNVLSVMAQCLGLAGLVTIMWFVFGYSFVFGEHDAANAPKWAGYVGNISKYMMLKDVGIAPNTNYTA
jgi:Amt family ammonium transporter